MLGDDYWDILVDEDADVYLPDGRPLLKLRKNVLSAKACSAAYKALRKAALPSDNRGLAAGKVKREKVQYQNDDLVTFGGGVRFRPVKKDGTLSKTNYANVVKSGIVGYFDRSSRFPYCRETAWNIDNPERFGAAMPYFQEIDAVFAAEMPERHAAQMARVEKTHPAWVINDTAFTTVTVNSDFRTALHTDRGDLKEGFGVMTALRRGAYTGCYTLWPKWGVAANMTTGCVLMADVHEWHCNSPLLGIPGQFERVACVLYYRENMVECHSPNAETNRAKKKRDLAH